MLKEGFTVRELVAESWTTAESKGFHFEDRTFGDVIALIHSEASEALEDYRQGYAPTDSWVDENGKPCGVASEMADIVIRVADACGCYGIDLEEALISKANYNATRPHLHGGKTL